MENTDELVAIVAMECKLPGIANVEELWQRLVDEECTISDLTDEQLAEAGVPEKRYSASDYVRRAGILEDLDEFDSAYFGYSPKEADVLDVQQRLMLQLCVALLERANIDPHRTDKRIGVYLGSAMSSYLFGVLQDEDLVDSLGEMMVRQANDKDFLATRVSYKLNLRGPSVNVQTACSTGLVAVHSAVQSLILGECDMAIAGATYVRVPETAGYRYQVGGVLSPDGTCRPFDAAANGTLFTNGLGVVLVKRLADAIEDGDEIVAVIAGSAVNNDGAEKVSFTAPSVVGQVAVLRDALTVAGVDPADVSYIEAHGTGTALGDPIEIEAIKQAYGSEGSPCVIGSHKGNFGHLNIAAGIIGLIKAALVLRHEFIPGTVGFSNENPGLELAGTRFSVQGQGIEYESDRVKWAGVSAFGMGGTNSHVLLRNHLVSENAVDDEVAGPRILTFSGTSDEALARQARVLGEHLDTNAGRMSLSECASTLVSGRTRHPFRGAVVASSSADAVARLRSGRFHRGGPRKREPVAFAFGGQGTQHPAMGAALARGNPGFAKALEQTVETLDKYLDFSIIDYLWSGRDAADLKDTSVAQPLLFAVEYALATSLIEAGVKPDYLFGHSLGEVVAAAVSGAFDLRTAAELVAQRSRLMSQSVPGAMLAIDHLDPFLDLVADATLSIAARNSPRQFVLSGSVDAIDATIVRAQELGVYHQRLATSHAFHSASMQEASDAFAEFLTGFRFQIPTIPIISNITGRVLSEYEVCNPRYWADHMVRAVDFSGSVETLLAAGVRTFIEIGRGRAMSNLVLSSSGAITVTTIAALGEQDDECESFADAIAFAWAHDPATDIDAFTPRTRSVLLPTYAFEKRKHWIRPISRFGRSVNSDLTRPDEAPACADKQPGIVSLAADVPSSGDIGIDAGEDVLTAVVSELFTRFLGGGLLDEASSFFDLGGNSLMAIQLINKLRETFQVDVSVRDFYQNSSISGVGAMLENLLSQEPSRA